jgi:hypothetical protein
LRLVALALLMCRFLIVEGTRQLLQSRNVDDLSRLAGRYDALDLAHEMISRSASMSST